MSGEMILILCSGSGEISAATVRTTCGAWKVPQTVSAPLILSKLATQQAVSIGLAWQR